MNLIDNVGPEATYNAQSGVRGRRSTVLSRIGAVGTAAALVVLGLAAPASAHVSVTPSTTAAGAFAILEFSLSHGCDGAATTGLTIQLPAEINAATPTRDPLWEAEKRVVDLDPAVTDAYGNEISERVESVTFTTNEPLADGVRDTVLLSVQIPDAEGATLAFPVIQTCGEAESAWIQVPEAGLSVDDLELPAPSFIVTAADAPSQGDAQTAAESPEATGEPDEERSGSTVAAVSPESSTSADDDSPILTIAALAAGVLGVLVGAAALVLQRRTR